MSYIVIKTVKGRKYRYEQWSWREGKKVRTKSRCLGPADGGRRIAGVPKVGLRKRIRDFVKAQGPFFKAVLNEDEILKQYNDRVEKQRAAHEKALGDLHDRYGLKVGGLNPTPIDKPAPAASIQLAAQEEAPAVAEAEVQ